MAEVDRGVPPRPGPSSCSPRCGRRDPARAGLELRRGVRPADPGLGGPARRRPVRRDRERRRRRAPQAGARPLPRGLPPRSARRRARAPPWRTRRPGSPPPPRRACRDRRALLPGRGAAGRHARGRRSLADAAVHAALGLQASPTLWLTLVAVLADLHRGFFDAVGAVLLQPRPTSTGSSLLLALLCFGVYLTLRSRAFFHILRAAYPAERIRWRRIWGAYIAAYGFNNVVPARGGDVIKLFLTQDLDPGLDATRRSARRSSSRSVFDATMGVLILHVRLHAGRVPQAAGLREAQRVRPVVLRVAPALHAVPAHGAGGRRARRLRAALAPGARVLGARAPGPDDPLRPPPLPARGLARAVRRLAVPLRGVLVPARRVQRRRLGAQRAARARRQRGGGASSRSRPAARACSRRCS